MHARTCGLSPEKLVIAKEEFDKMEEMGIVWRLSSSWASHLHMVPKALDAARETSLQRNKSLNIIVQEKL